MLEIVIYGGYLALFGSAFGVIWAEPRARAWLRRRRVADWGQLAWELRLHWHRSNDRMSGWLDGRYLAVWPAEMASMPRGTQVAVMLWPPLDIGLLATAEPGQPSWSIKAGEAPRARELLDKLRLTLDTEQRHWVRLDDQRLLLVAPKYRIPSKGRGHDPASASDRTTGGHCPCGREACRCRDVDCRQLASACIRPSLRAGVDAVRLHRHEPRARGARLHPTGR
jgi:hypothetical protein